MDIPALATMLAYFSERRGSDSWGIAKQDKPTDTPTVIKEVGPITKSRPIKNLTSLQVIGHTRNATVGAVNKKNAHPFWVGNIIGAHNGHVQNWEELNKRHKRKCEVDSEHIFYNIAEGKPIEELGGSGTVTYLDLAQPGKIFLGRGLYSDLEIFSLGPSSKPWGTVWASIAMWGEDALEMAGVEEFDSWDTHYSTLYELEDNQLCEVDAFNLKTQYSGPQTYQGGDYKPYSVPSCRGQVGGYKPEPPRIWDQDTRSYIESKTMEEYWGKLRENQIKRGVIPADDIEHLPPSLKKNTEISILETSEGQKAVETSLQCDGCNGWGTLVEDYSDNASGIVEHASIDQYLCFQCSCFWGQQTGTAEARAVVVPDLSLKMEY